MAQNRIICVVGMHRSGTSMITHLLHGCGLYLGPADRLLKAEKTNPLGHFEHRGFLDIDRKLLQHYHAAWYNPPDLPPNWHLDPSLMPLLSQARALTNEFPANQPWGWKEPRASLFLPFWRQAMPNMDFVICVRNPLEVARSLQKRNRMDIAHGAWLWYLYNLVALRDSQDSNRLILLFDDFFERQDDAIARLLAFCAVGNSKSAALLSSAVAAELRHHTSGDQLLRDDSAVADQCKDLYFSLRATLADNRSSDPDRVAPAAAVAALLRQFNTASAFQYLALNAFTRSRQSPSGHKLQRLLKSLRRPSS